MFVCNDWHTGPLSCYLKSNYQSNGIYRDAKVSFLLYIFGQCCLRFGCPFIYVYPILF